MICQVDVLNLELAGGGRICVFQMKFKSPSMCGNEDFDEMS